MRTFVAGLLVMGYAVSAVFFARFWRETRDRLFLFFAAAFGLLALQRTLLSSSDSLPLDQTWYYVVRLIAYLLILAAIVDKNARRS
jgi:hypothetical protein